MLSGVDIRDDPCPELPLNIKDRLKSKPNIAVSKYDFTTPYPEKVCENACTGKLLTYKTLDTIYSPEARVERKHKDGIARRFTDFILNVSCFFFSSRLG